MYIHVINEVPKANAKRVKYIHAQHLTISRNTWWFSGCKIDNNFETKKERFFFQYYLVDFEWVVNTPIFAYTSAKKLVKSNARVIILFIMAKDYEHKPNLSELFTISLKILEILHYKSHEAPEWKLCEVF